MQTGALLANRYRIDAKLGEGGMGVVYKAHDTLLQRPVAIKTLAPGLFGDEGARRILREAQSVARLNHTQIVSIFDAIEETGSFAIVMEFVEGKTLRELIPVPIDRLIAIATQVVQALEYAHAQGIVHRDIKPENIIIAADGVAKLMDFGLARSEGRSRLTQTGMVVGTVAYLAPEQALGGQVDGRSDLYSLGAVLYEAVAGRPPFESDDPISVITQHINVPPVAPHWHNPAVPPGLENIILRLLAKDPARRYQSAREVLEALATVTTTGQAAAPTPEKLAGPELVERIAHTPLVGRDAELSRLKGLVDRTITGQGGVVLATGPLGVGKTRLVEEAATFARLRGMAVVSGKAYESAPPYEPFAKALRELARGVDSDTLAARLGEFAPEVVGLIPDLSRQLPRLGERAAGSPEDRKSRLFAGVAHFLSATGAHHPVLLILDDMHLADAATSELLQHVARRADAARLLLIVAYRPEDIPATPAGKLFGQITHVLSRESFCTTLALSPLNADQVVDLIKLMANHPARPERFGRRIFEVTEGNPYFIEEVIKGLFAQGALYIKEGQWSTDFDESRDYSLLETPSSIHAAVEARLRNLDDQSRQVLTQAAVIGRQFTFDSLLGVSGLDENTLLDRVEGATRAQLIREVRGVAEDTYEFAQPMLRQVLYDSIPRRRRRLVHRQAGETLEKLSGRKPDTHAEALAFHFSEAEDFEKTLHYSRLAGRKAAAVFAYDDAIRHLREAINAAAELDRPQEQFELMEELADILFTAGKREQVIQAYEDAVQFWKSLPAASMTDGARLYRKLGEIGSRWGTYNPRAREHIAEGLRILEGSPEHPERVKLIIARAFSRYWLMPALEVNYAAGEQDALEGYRLAETIGSAKDMSAALDALAGMYDTRTDFARMLETTQKRIPIVERLKDPLELADLHFMLCRANFSLGNFPEAIKNIDQVREVASRSGVGTYLFNGFGWPAWIYLNWDRLDATEQWCQRYRDAESKAGFTHNVGRWVIMAQAVAAAIRGNLDESRRLQEELQGRPAVSPSLRWGPSYTTALAALASGDRDKARAALASAIEMIDTPFSGLVVRTLALEYAAQFREWEHVEQFGQETLALSRQSKARRLLAANSRALGVYRLEHGRLDESDTLLSESSQLFRDLDCRYQLAKTLRELARLRKAQGRASDAAPLLQEALTHFESLGARPDIERTRALL